MNDTVIVTCLYTNLHGTKYGGRDGRESQYFSSLASLLKITNADFVIYCDPDQESELKSLVESTAKTKVTIIPYSLENFYMKDLFDRYKDHEQSRSSQRCQEIQYLKTYWMSKIEDYEYIFWFDIGISYSGLIPNKHLIFADNAEYEYYNSDLFCNDLIDGMKIASNQKLLLFAIHNAYPVPYRRLIPEYFDREYDSPNDSDAYHIIAGILGGKINKVKKFHVLFEETSKLMIEELNVVHDEESVYNIIHKKRPRKFNVQRFNMWWHEDSLHSIYQDHPEKIEEVKHLKSFYHTLEDLITIGNNHD